MSVSINIIFTEIINLNSFIDFVVNEGGFVNDDNQSGGFNYKESYVWFYGIKDTLCPDVNAKEYLLEISLYSNRDEVPNSYIYFELSSFPNSQNLMIEIAQKISRRWPIFIDCNLYKLLNAEKLKQFINNKNLQKGLLGNSFTFFYSDDVEKKIESIINNKYSNYLMKSFSNKFDVLMDKEDVLKSIYINNLEIHFSVVYEYENENLQLTNAIRNYFGKKPFYFSEMYFGYDIEDQQKNTIMDIAYILTNITGGVCISIFREIIDHNEIQSLHNELYIKFA